MKPTHLEVRQLKRYDERLARFKDSNFEACGYDADWSTLFYLFIFSIPVIGFGLLIIAFLIEWYLKLIRMMKIVLTKLYIMLMKLPFTKILLTMAFILIVLFILSSILS